MFNIIFIVMIGVLINWGNKLFVFKGLVCIVKVVLNFLLLWWYLRWIISVWVKGLIF